MRSLILFLLILGTGVVMAGCSQSSAKYDLKSPCVSNDNGSATAPCIRRRPLDNYLA